MMHTRCNLQELDNLLSDIKDEGEQMEARSCAALYIIGRDDFYERQRLKVLLVKHQGAESPVVGRVLGLVSELRRRIFFGLSNTTSAHSIRFAVMAKLCQHRDPAGIIDKVHEVSQ